MIKLRRMLPRNKPLFLRNFIFVMLVLLLFSCVVVAIYQHQIHQMILGDIELLNLSTLEQNIQTLDGVMLGLREMTYSVSQGDEMDVFFESDPQIESMQERFDENLEKVLSRLNHYRAASPYVESVYVYSSRMDKMVGSTRWINKSLLLSDAWRAVVAQDNEKRNVEVFFQRWNNQYPYLLTLIRAVPGARGTVKGYAMVDVNIEKLGALVLGSFPDKESTRLFIAEPSGQMILSTPYYLLGDQDTLPGELQAFAGEEAGYSKMVRMEDGEYIVSCQDSSQEGWRYILIRPYDRYFSLASRGEWIFSLMIGLVLVLVLLVVASIVFTTFRPLNRIITAIDAPAAVRPSVQSRQSKGMQEVERIIQSVYDLRSSNSAMQFQLSEQIHEFSLEQVRALQHQMDPHFLYNVLDYFRWVAIDELGEGNALEEMARTLSQYFHIALRRSDYLVPLRDELHHVDLFMQLYAYRYAGRLQVHRDVPEDMLDCRVLKLSVQPIVDNAIKHGLRPRRYMGNIWIGAHREEDAIVVTVENDGERMPEKELARVNAQLAHPEASDLDEHIGLPNIARRIHLLFGAAFGVSLQNTSTGMIAVMRLPERVSGMEEIPASAPAPKDS